jgi:Ca2+-binding EF-hand superfamily protein
MQEFAVGLSPVEAKMCFDYFDKNGDGVIDIDEFVRGMRGELNEIRRPVVDAAFVKFDADNTGFIDINDIRGVYDASFHPKV